MADFNTVFNNPRPYDNRQLNTVNGIRPITQNPLRKNQTKHRTRQQRHVGWNNGSTEGKIEGLTTETDPIVVDETDPIVIDEMDSIVVDETNPIVVMNRVDDTEQIIIPKHTNLPPQPQPERKPIPKISVYDQNTDKERLIFDVNKEYPGGLIMNNYAEFNYDAEFQGEQIRNLGTLKNSKGIAVVNRSAAVSNDDLQRRSIQMSTDTSYGGVHDDHTGSLMYTIMPSGWGGAQTGIRHSTGWGEFAEDDSMTISRDKTTVRKNLNVGGDLNVTGTIKTTQSFGNPIGTIIQWPSDNPPTGYLLCDSSAVSRETHSALFAIIGTTFGSGDDTTTFNLPDYRGYVLVGKNSTDTDTNTIDNIHRGEKTHLLTINEMPSHSHTSAEHSHTTKVIDPGHIHKVNGSVVTSGGTGHYDGGGAGQLNSKLYTTTDTSNVQFSIQPTTIKINNSGGDQHFNIMQPYKVVNYCIRG